MTSPYPLAVAVDMKIDGTWTVLSSRVYQREIIAMRWGRANEASTVSPSTCSMQLNNRDGVLSPRNPASTYYGKIGRNTPIRVRLGTSRASLRLFGESSSYASTPDHASLDIVGDFDVRMECDPDTWRPDEFLAFARKYVTTGDQRSWAWWLTAAGELRVRWSPDGTFASSIAITSTAVIPEASERLAIRWTIDVDNGATGNDVKFYTAASKAGPWTQLGATVTTAGVTSIFSSSAALEVGRTHSSDLPGITDDPFAGRIHAFELRNGIGGTVVANPAFTTVALDAASFTDAAGRAWTLNGQSYIVDPSVRFAGEITTWDPRADGSGRDAYVKIEARSIRRRLGQGSAPLRSSLYRDFIRKGNLVAYWPLEDGRDATRFAPAIGTDHLSYSGDVSLAASDVFAASDNLPTVNDGRIYGPVQAYVGDADQRVLMLIDVPAAGVAAETQLLYLHTRGTAKFWILSLRTDGSLRIQALDDGGTSLLDASLGYALEGKQGILSLWLSQVGAAIDWQVSFFEVGASSALVFSGTLAARTWGSFGHIRIGGLGGADLAGVTVGHLAIMNGDVHTGLWATVGSSLTGWAGETAGARMLRLTAEEGIPFRLIGDPANTAALGPQRVRTLMQLLDAAAATDLGMWGDAREVIALEYRPRDRLYKQPVALTIDNSAGQLATPLEPLDDDQGTANDVTVERDGGSTANAVLEAGAMSTLDPPDGVGRYEDSVTLSLERDGQLADQAGWRLHLGTVDESRIPQVAVHLGRNPGLSDDATAVRPGDRIEITNPSAWLPPNTIDQQVQGGTEILGPFRHEISYHTSPAAPWTVGEVAPNAPAAIGADDPNRADTDGSELAAAFVAGTGTSMSVSVTAGPLWTTAASEFPLHIRTGGVILNVTAITGATSPQTFTITQTPVNGITKTIAAGTDVRLAQPAIAAL